MKNTRIRAALIVASTLAGAGILAGPAQATTYYHWGTLYAGSLAMGRGNVYNNGGVQIEDASYQYQRENGDNGAYVSSHFLYWETGNDCGYSQSLNRSPAGTSHPRPTSRPSGPSSTRGSGAPATRVFRCTGPRRAHGRRSARTSAGGRTPARQRPP